MIIFNAVRLYVWRNGFCLRFFCATTCPEILPAITHTMGTHYHARMEGIAKSSKGATPLIYLKPGNATEVYLKTSAT